MRSCWRRDGERRPPGMEGDHCSSLRTTLCHTGVERSWSSPPLFMVIPWPVFSLLPNRQTWSRRYPPSDGAIFLKSAEAEPTLIGTDGAVQVLLKRPSTRARSAILGHCKGAQGCIFRHVDASIHIEHRRIERDVH